MIRKKYHNNIIFVLFGIAGVIALLFVTKLGVGMNRGSVNYIDLARNFSAGHGLVALSFYVGRVIPWVWYPPLYSIVLACVGFFGIDLLDAARWMNALLFGFNVFMAGFLVYRYSKYLWASILGSLLVFTSVDMLFIHSMAWAEPLFISLGILGLFFLDVYFEKRNYSFLIISALFIALAFLDRYVGISLVIVGIISIFFMAKEKYEKKILPCLVFAGVSCFPIACWFIRNLYVVGKLTGRRPFFHPITLYNLESAVNVFSLWLLPGSIPSAVRYSLFLLIALSLFILIVVFMKKAKVANKPLVPGFLWILFNFIWVYFVFLILSISFFDRYTPLDNRILLPLYIPAVILVLCLAPKLLDYFKGIRIRRIVFFLCVLFSIFYVIRSLVWSIDMHNNGSKYSWKTWSKFQIIQKIKTFSFSVPIYSNAPEIIYFLTGRHAIGLPIELNKKIHLVNAGYSSQLVRMKKRLKNESGIIVYLDEINFWSLPSEKELKENLHLHLLFETPDGSIYGEMD